MKLNASLHSGGQADFLGTTIAANSILIYFNLRLFSIHAYGFVTQ